MSESGELRGDARVLAGVRLGIGLLQGLALYLLYTAFDDHGWPATDGVVFGPIVLVAVYLPLLIAQSVGNLRTITLIVWGLVATGVVAGLGWYDLWRQWPVTSIWIHGVRQNGAPMIPSFEVFFFGAIWLFIGHALVTSADSARRFFAPYSTYFDAAWKFGVQLALSAAFVGAFWLLLWLGSELFQLIGLHFLEKLIEHEWFSIPVTTLAVAMALHVTDVRAGLVRGARTLALVLLAWLLPLMAVFAIGFFAALPFTGLEPLWKTNSAAGILLVAAGVLVILINAAYQDGENEHHAVPLVLRYAVRAAAIVLIPVTVLGAYAIYLRVAQYGWTVDRVSGSAVAFVAFGYALGYAMAAVLPGAWMTLLARWNLAMALVVLAVLLALFTPLADPARIAVSDQVARLKAGKTAPEKFDFSFLRYHGERFGHDALSDLKAHGAWKAIREAASQSLSDKGPYAGFTQTVNIAASITVYPKGQHLPASFLKQDWRGASVPGCMFVAAMKCDAFYADMDGDGKDEVLVSEGLGDYLGTLHVFALDAQQRWSAVGTLQMPVICPKAIAALRSGSLRQMGPESRWHNLDAGGVRLPFVPTPGNCPK